VVRILSSDGAIVGISYAPWMHDEAATESTEWGADGATRSRVRALGARSNADPAATCRPKRRTNGVSAEREWAARGLRLRPTSW